MEFDELPTHIQEQWEQSEQFGDELRMIRTLRAGKHGEWAWSKDKSEFTADAIKKIERHRRGFFHPHEAAAEISRLKPFEEAAERKLLTKIVDDIKTGIIPIYREPLMFKETFTTDDRYSELEILLNASDLNEWLRSRNTDLQLMTPEHSAAPNLPLTNVKSLSTPQTAPASEPVTCASVPSTRHRLRTNSLDVPIKKAITEADSFQTGAVYLQLREMALSGELPFSGEIENGALCYTNDAGKPDKLTKNALGKRLKKHRLCAVSRR